GQKRGMLPDDYYRFIFVSDPRISPDGERVAFVAAKVSEDKRSRESRIWMVPFDGTKEPVCFTQGNNDRSPRWSPDGKWLAFVSRRDKQPQVHLISPDGGEAFPLTELDASPSSIQWSPDGKKLLMLLRTGEEPDAGKSDQKEDPKPDISVIKLSRYQANGQSDYLDEKRAHIWVFDLETKVSKQLTRGMDWNASCPVWSPDSRNIAFVSNRTGKEYEGDQNSDIWIVPAVGGEPKPVTTQSHQDGSPKWSPDGKSIAYVRTDRPYTQPDIYLTRVGNGEHRNLTADFDRILRSFSWSPDGKFLYFTTNDLGVVRLFRLDVGSREVQKLSGDEVSLGSVNLSKDGTRFAFTLGNEIRIPEIWASDSSGGGMKQLTYFNDTLLQSLELRKGEEFWFVNDANMKVQCFLFRPVDFQPDRKYPLILNIHGGPSGMWGRTWFQEFQMLAAKDYGVLVVNYRGSTGYGYGFQHPVVHDYGGVDYRDNIRGLDEALEKYDWIDENRLGVTGGSHGGYLTNWIITQTDRFKAAVTQRSISNWVSAHGTQDFTPQAMRIEFNGTPWENYDFYWDRSPIKYADRYLGVRP
ncbi:MAG: S9 family peptidase, partial [Deltaproteobacteria bacterium]|nr:S9 family peptidase [Deltaproteobacteria bacterium]